MLKFKSEIRWIASGQLFMLFGAFIGLKVLSNTLGPESYGELGLGLAIGSMINTIIYGPLGNGFGRFVNDYKHRGFLPHYFLFSFRFLSQVSLFFLIAAVVGIVFGSWFFSINHWLFVLGSIYGVAGGVQALLSGMLTSLSLRKFVAISQGTLFWLRFILAFLFCSIFGKSAIGALFGYVLADTLSLVYQMLFIKKEFVRGKSLLDFDEPSLRREITKYSLQFFVLSLFAIFISSADRWLANWLMDLKSVGVYFALTQIASAPVFIVSAVLSQFIIPMVFGDAAAKYSDTSRLLYAERIIKSAAWINFGTVLLGSLVAIPLSSFITQLFTSTAYIATDNLTLPLIIFGSGLYQTGALLNLYGQVYKSNSIYVFSVAAKAVLFTGLSIYLVREFGVKGFAIANVASSAVYILAILVTNRHMLKNRTMT